MAEMHVNYRCGCSGVMQIYGKSSERQAKADWIAERRSCSDCFAKERENDRERERESAIALAAEHDLPELSGTDRQVAWAEVLRARFVGWKIAADTALDGDESDEVSSSRYALMYVSREDFEAGYATILEETQAGWWIDSIDRFAGIEHGAFPSSVVAYYQRLIELGALKMVILTPVGNEISRVEMVHDERSVWVTTFRRESGSLIAKLRDIGFQWVGRAWHYRYLPSSALSEDVAAGIASEILAEGYAVSVSADLARTISNGDFEPEITRKIVYDDAAQAFVLRWRRSDDLYERLKSLPRARWCKSGLVVPLTSAPEVRDVAGRFGFWASPASQKALTAIEAIEIAGQRVVPGSRDVSMTAVREGVHADLLDD